MRWQSDMKLAYSKEPLYIACMDLDFGWKRTQLETVIEMWNQNYHPRAIAKKVKRDVDDVAVLLISLGREGRIQRRPSGLFGGISA